jgi:hypothetical protein
VEHVLAGLEAFEVELEDPALRLYLRDDVREHRRLERCPGVVVVEEVPMQVERVDRVELGDVDQVHTDGLVGTDPDRRGVVRERDRVDRIDLVLAVEVGVERVHDHDHLADPVVLRAL